MTKEFPVTRAGKFAGAAVSAWLFRLCRFLVISASSLAIQVLTLAIRAYQLTLSPLQTFLFGAAGGCRFTPACSQYAREAVREHGAVTGGWLAVRRIGRCHPWGDCGHDPVPKKGFAVRPSALRFDAAWIEARRAGAEGEGGNSEFGI